MKKKILVLTPRFPYPLIGGDRLRIFKICEELSKDYEVSLLSLTDDIKLEADNLRELRETNVFHKIDIVYKSKISSYLSALFYFFLGKPLQVGYYTSKELNRIFNKEHDDYDIVLCHLVRMADVLLNNKSNKNLINCLEMTDAISLNYSRVNGFSIKKLIYRLEKNRLFNFESKCASFFNSVCLISKTDSQYLIDRGVKFNKLDIISNGVDCHSLKINEFNDKKTIVFIGNMDSEQNFDAALWFAENVMPLVKDKKYIFKIVGNISESKKQILESIPNTIVLGKVPSISDSCSGSWIGVCPVRIGAGVQNKVLEYMALGIPSVISTVGHEGLSAIPERDCLIADKPEDYLLAFEKLQDDFIYSNIKVNAYNYVQEKHEWSSVLKNYSQLVS